MTTQITSPRRSQSTATTRPPKPGPGYVWNPALARWCYNEVLARANPPKTPRPLRQASITVAADGTGATALSSDGHTLYRLTSVPHPTCTCPAGNNGRRCYHLVAFASSHCAFWPAPWTIRRRPPTPPAAPARRSCPCDLYGPDACTGRCKPTAIAA